MANEVSIRKVSKNEETKEIPAGAKILSKESRITVEEIENGFLVTKSTDVRYTVGTGKDVHTEYAYLVKKAYSATDPYKVTVNTKDKSLADIFED